MSSFPKHKENLLKLQSIGMDISEYLDDDGTVSLESWGCDYQVDIVEEAIEMFITRITQLEAQLEQAKADAVREFADYLPKSTGVSREHIEHMAKRFIERHLNQKPN